MAGPESLDLAALAEARIMIVERLAIAILHPVDQRRLDPFAAVGKHPIGGDHLIERRLASAERIGEMQGHVLVYAKTLGIFGDAIHADGLCNPHCHQVSRKLQPLAKWQWPREI